MSVAALGLLVAGLTFAWCVVILAAESRRAQHRQRQPHGTMLRNGLGTYRRRRDVRRVQPPPFDLVRRAPKQVTPYFDLRPRTSPTDSLEAVDPTNGSRARHPGT